MYDKGIDAINHIDTHLERCRVYNTQIRSYCHDPPLFYHQSTLLLSETDELHPCSPSCLHQYPLQVLQFPAEIILLSGGALWTCLVGCICLRNGCVNLVEDVHRFLVDIRQDGSI
jgi:hypothetical protein